MQFNSSTLKYKFLLPISFSLFKITGILFVISLISTLAIILRFWLSIPNSGSNMHDEHEHGGSGTVVWDSSFTLVTEDENLVLNASETPVQISFDTDLDDNDWSQKKKARSSENSFSGSIRNLFRKLELLSPEFHNHEYNLRRLGRSRVEKVSHKFKQSNKNLPSVKGNRTELVAIFKARSQHIDEICTKIKRPIISTKNASNLVTYQTYLMSIRQSNRRPWIFYKGDRKNREQALQLDWCPIFKAASSTWMAVFTLLRGALTPKTEEAIKKGQITFMKLAKDFRMQIPPPSIPLIKRRQLHRRGPPTPDEYKNSEQSANGKPRPRLNGLEYYQMLIVRHPFDRLLSAYRDKLERMQGREYYHRKYGYKIVGMFRLKSSNKTGVSGSSESKKISHRKMNGLLIGEVLRQLAGTGLGAHGRASTIQDFKIPVISEDYTPPSFSEFIQFIISTGKSNPLGMDEHWRPITLDCQPCLHSYNLILKVETMSQDKEIIFKLLGFEQGSAEYKELANAWSRWAHKSGKSSESSSSNGNFKNKEEYFSQLSRKDLNALYELYKLDFLLFDYTADEYFNMAREAKKIFSNLANTKA